MAQQAPEREHNELIGRISKAGRQWKRRLAITGLVRTLTIACAAFGLLLVLDAFAVLPSAVRIAWLAPIVVFALAALWFWVLRPLTRRIDPVSLAARVEEKHPELGEMLESSVELWSKRGHGKHGYSSDLIDALILKATTEAMSLNFGSALTVRSQRTWLWRLGAVAAAFVLVAFLLSSRVVPALSRLAHPFASAKVPAVTLEVEPGDVTVVAGDDLVIRATVDGPAADLSDGAVLRYTVSGEPEVTRSMRSEPNAPGSFTALLSGLRADHVYSVQAPGVESPDYDVRVLDPPFVTGIALGYRYPDYSGLVPREVDENNGDITALKGTKVTVTVRSSKPLESGRLAFRTGEETPLAELAPGSYQARITVGENTRYTIEIVDRDGLTNPDPPGYSIVALSDEYPLVKLVEPGRDAEVPRGMTLPVLVSAIDDYGVSKLNIRYSIEGLAQEGVVELGRYGARGQREVAKEAVWDLNETGIMPGMIMIYFAEAIDNDVVTGPKTSRSESYLLRFPSMAELYREVTGEQDEVIDDLDEIAEEQEEIQELFEELDDDIKSEPEIDWQDEEKMETALERQEELTEGVEELADRMSDLTEKMSDTDQITLETLEKMSEITKLLDEVATDEMRELIQQIREAMEQISPEDVSSAMEEMTLSQEDYLRRLEQTLNLLKRVKAEQQLADLANRAESLAERQEAVAEEANRSPNSESCENLANREAGLKKEAEQLLEDLKDAASEMQELDKETAGDMEQASSEMDSACTLDKMEDAQQKFAQMKPKEAASQCQSSASDFKALFQRLSSCQGGMACKMNTLSQEAVMRAVDQLLGVSREQEEILSSVEGRQRIPRKDLVELVAKETDLVEALTGIAERMFMVSKDTFVVDPSIYRAFGTVQLYMTRAASRIAEGGIAAGTKEARGALGSVNGLIVQLLSANMSMSPSGSSGSLQQLMDQLQSMAQQQTELNMATEELMRQMQQMGNNPQMQRQLAEIKGHQENMLEEAKRLAEEVSDKGEILGRLDDTVEEMEKTVAEMERGGVSQDVVNRQKRILSRLLDAQRSLRRRDYTRERLSRTGGEYVRLKPGQLPPDQAKAEEELREDLLRAMQHDYPREYRELIRAYFESLSQDVAGEAGTGGGEVVR